MPIQQTITGSGSSLSGLGGPGLTPQMASSFNGWMANLARRAEDARAAEEKRRRDEAAMAEREFASGQADAALNRDLALQASKRDAARSAIEMAKERMALNEAKKDAMLMDYGGPRHFKTGAVSDAPAGGFLDTSRMNARAARIYNPQSASFQGASSSPGGFGAEGEGPEPAPQGMSPDEEGQARNDAYVRQNPYSAGMMDPFKIESEEDFRRRKARELMGSVQGFGGLSGDTGGDLAIYGG